jgi:hypothetical protein
MAGELTWTLEFPADGPPDVVVTTAGIATHAGLDRWTEAVAADERFPTGARLLVDHRALDWRRFDRAELFGRVDSVAAQLGRMHVRAIGVVLGSPLAYGLQRMMQAYVEEHATRLGVRFGAFTSVPDAVAWLQQPAFATATATIT